MITNATVFEEDRIARQGLAGCSLVCRHWSNVISPMLFEFITLRSLKDIQFLRNVIDKAPASRLYLVDSIQTICVDEDAEDLSQATSWLHHTHSLCVRLSKALFYYTVYRNVGDDRATVESSAASAVQARVFRPFRSLPRLPPLSSLRLTYLDLDGLQFASKTELSRFIDSFRTLKECQCDQLTFVDPSPIVQSRRCQWRPSQSLQWCSMWRCDGTAFATQAALVSDILMTPAHLSLDGDAWSTIQEALLALAPASFDRAEMGLDCDDELGMSLRCYQMTIARC